MPPGVHLNQAIKEYGVCNPGFGTLAQMRQIFANIASGGFKWVRTDISWPSVQPDANTFNWTKYDIFVQAAKENNVNVLFIIDYTPGWANGNQAPNYPPTDPTIFATFCATVVNRYSRQGVKTYEIWNEPNIVQFWQPAPNIANYVNLLETAYVAMKKIDPSVQILSAGLAPAVDDATHISPINFLSGIYANGGGDYFDAVAYHPYSIPAFPSNPVGWNGWQKLFNLRLIMCQNGDREKKIWFTEYGAPTNGTSGQEFITEAQQAAMLSEAINLQQTYTWAGPMMFYAYKDYAPAQPDREGYFGLRRSDDTLKPVWDVIKNQIS